MCLLAKAPKNVKERLKWLERLLTQERVDAKISHYDRQLLTEHVEELNTEVAGDDSGVLNLGDL